MARGADQDISEIKQRLALLETRMEQLFEKVDIAPRNAPEGGGWWGGSENQQAGDPDSDPEVLQLISEKKTIEAIKRYHELTGVGLAEAKKAVERLGG